MKEQKSIYSNKTAFFALSQTMYYKKRKGTLNLIYLIKRFLLPKNYVKNRRNF